MPSRPQMSNRPPSAQRPPHRRSTRMIYTMQYESPLGPIVVSCDDDAITGLWFEGQKYFGSTLPAESLPKESPS
ncbi:hypothetical protein ACUY27_12545, partial [Corynebacterium pyruviciproducens]